MKGLLLLLVAILLSIVLFPIGFILSLFSRGRNAIFFQIAIAIDQLGNVVCARLLNLTLRKNDGYKFGFEDETISSVIGKNQLTNTLTKTGRMLDSLLSDFQADHAIKSIENFTKQ